MGGRKSYSINSVIRKDPSTIAKKGHLTRAFKKEDISGITRSTINLLPGHRDIVKIFVYSERLSNEIIDKYSSSELKIVKQIVPKVRKDWAKLKRKENLDSNKIIDNAVIYAVSTFLVERNK